MKNTKNRKENRFLDLLARKGEQEAIRFASANRIRGFAARRLGAERYEAAVRHARLARVRAELARAAA